MPERHIIRTSYCSYCQQTKPVEEFNKCAKAKDGCSGYCKKCAREKALAKFHNDPEPYRERARQRYRDDPSKINGTEYQRKGNGRLIRNGINTRRRLQKQGLEVDNVIVRTVWERSNGMCGICDEPVTLSEMHVDHILPLARGGTHTYDNVQAAHPICNLRKGTSIAS